MFVSFAHGSAAAFKIDIWINVFINLSLSPLPVVLFIQKMQSYCIVGTDIRMHILTDFFVGKIHLDVSLSYLRIIIITYMYCSILNWRVNTGNYLVLSKQKNLVLFTTCLLACCCLRSGREREREKEHFIYYMYKVKITAY